MFLVFLQLQATLFLFYIFIYAISWLPIEKCMTLLLNLLVRGSLQFT